MGLIDYHYYAWKPQPEIFFYITVVILPILFLAVIITSFRMVLDGMPFFYPGVFMAIVILWMFGGVIHRIKKTTGFQFKVFRIKPELCKRIVERVLSDLGLEFESIDGEKVNLIFLWTIHYDHILHLINEDISVSFVFSKLSQSTAIYIGKVEPSNKDLIKRIEDGIDMGTSPRYMENE